MNSARFELPDDALVERPYRRLSPILKHAIDCYRQAAYNFRRRERGLKALMHHEGLDAITDIPQFNGSLVYSREADELKSVRAMKPNGSKIPA